jgi:hypothetical protein
MGFVNFLCDEGAGMAPRINALCIREVGNARKRQYTEKEGDESRFAGHGRPFTKKDLARI